MSRASTPSLTGKDVDGRDKPGHDEYKYPTLISPIENR
jgi:hypothetical protein